MTTTDDPRTARRRRGTVATVLAAVTLAGTVAAATSAYSSTTTADSTVVACPAEPAAATCHTGRDATGAYFTMAVPERWSRSLVVFAHGGPDIAVDPASTTADLKEWAVMVNEGYAWVASSYRRRGYGVRAAAADVENVRRLFVGRFGRLARTYLHGQSFGGNVAAKVAETYGRQRGAYDGVLLTNGLLAGGSRGYDHRVDLRAVYQYYCRNLPRPSEAQYPLWNGLPADSTMTPADVLAVTRTPERSLETNMLYASFLFQDIVSRRLDGRNPFSNRGVRYTGSHDDKALNAGVERFSADPTARRDLSYDSDLTGEISLPVLTLHAIGDPSVAVEHGAAYRATVRNAGRSRFLVQTFTTESEHGELSNAEYATSIAALDRWMRSGRKPDPQSIAGSCAAFDRTYGSGCFYDPAFSPSPYASKIRPRDGNVRWPAMTAAQERAWSRIDGVGIAA